MATAREVLEAENPPAAGDSSGGLVWRILCGRRYGLATTACWADVRELSDRVVRASSLVENLNSRLRTDFFLRR